jgi:hypothetical protein
VELPGGNLQIGKVTLGSRSNPQCDASVARLVHVEARSAAFYFDPVFGPDTRPGALPLILFSLINPPGGGPTVRGVRRVGCDEAYNSGLSFRLVSFRKRENRSSPSKASQAAWQPTLRRSRGCIDGAYFVHPGMNITKPQSCEAVASS